MTKKTKVSTQEALQILNLQKSEMKPDLVLKVWWREVDYRVRTLSCVCPIWRSGVIGGTSVDFRRLQGMTPTR